MRRISLGVFTLVSVLLLLRGYEGYRSYRMTGRGNALSREGRYEEAGRIYTEAAERYGSRAASENLIVSLYEAGEYEKLLEKNYGDEFLRGNAYVYEGREKQKEQYYRGALEEYRSRMKESRDINIKKNYEIVKGLLEDLEDLNRKKQKQQDEEEKEDSQGESGAGDQDREGDAGKRDDTGGQDKDQGDEQGGEKQKEGDDPQSGKDKQEDPGEGEGNREPEQGVPEMSAAEETAGRRGIEEAMGILKRLEGNESQAFRNNERLEEIGGDDNGDSW